MTNYSKTYYYQDKIFYEKNKDNFINSLSMLLTYDTLSDSDKLSVYYRNKNSKNKTPKLFRNFNKIIKDGKLDTIEIIYFLISSIEKCINAFQEYIKFGTLVEYNITDSVVYYLLKLPKGLNVYHASKKLNLAHVQYNIRYKNFNDPFTYPNYEISKEGGLNSFFGDIETASAYIPPSYDIMNIYRNESFDIDQLTPIEGMNTFILNDDVYVLPYVYDFLNYFPPEIFNNKSINNSLKKKLFDIMDFSTINLNSLYSSYTILDNPTFFKVVGLSDLFETYKFQEDKEYTIIFNFLQGVINKKLIKRVDPDTGIEYKIYHYTKGIVELNDLFEYIELSMQFDKNFQQSVNNFIFEQKKRRKNIDFIKYIYENEIEPVISNIFSKYRGYRVSFYDSDWEIFNRMSHIIKNEFIIELGNEYSLVNNKIYGFIATSIVHFLDIDAFHQEMFFYDPTIINNNYIQIMQRNYENIYDNNYGINDFEMIQELRKYLTTNLLIDDFNGFHQGHLLEHSIWTAQYALLIMYYIINKYNTLSSVINFSNNEYIILVYLAAFYHDIGKAGDCNFYTYEYVNRDPTMLDIQECIFNKVTKTFEYPNISIHPEKSYEYLTGKREFKFSDSNLNFPNDNNYRYNLKNYFINIFNEYVDIYYYNIFTIAIACHWEFGDILLRNYDEIINFNDQSYIKEYLDRISFYILPYDKNVLLIVSFVTMIISLADILGSHSFNDPNNFVKINSIINKLPDKYKDIFLQLNKNLPKNTKNDIPFEKTVIRKDYNTIFDQSIILFISTLKYATNIYVYDPKNNYQDYYSLLNNKDLKNDPKFFSYLPKNIFLDINILIDKSDIMDINEFKNIISSIKSTLGDVNIIIYGNLGKGTKKLNNFIKDLSNLGIYIYIDNSYENDNEKYYDNPIYNFHKDQGIILEKDILIKYDTNYDSTFDKNKVQSVVLYNYFSTNMNANFKNILIKGIYLAIWNFYILS